MVITSQIMNILKREHEILDDFENNVPSSRKRQRRVTGNENINKSCWMKGFDYSMKYYTLVVKEKNNYMLCFVCYFIPVVMLLLFTFIVDEMCEKFTNCFLKITKECIPTKIVTIRIFGITIGPSSYQSICYYLKT
jgi:hypothetical protein